MEFVNFEEFPFLTEMDHLSPDFFNNLNTIDFNILRFTELSEKIYQQFYQFIDLYKQKQRINEEIINSINEYTNFFSQPSEIDYINQFSKFSEMFKLINDNDNVLSEQLNYIFEQSTKEFEIKKNLFNHSRKNTKKSLISYKKTWNTFLDMQNLGNIKEINTYKKIEAKFYHHQNISQNTLIRYIGDLQELHFQSKFDLVKTFSTFTLSFLSVLNNASKSFIDFKGEFESIYDKISSKEQYISNKMVKFEEEFMPKFDEMSKTNDDMMQKFDTLKKPKYENSVKKPPNSFVKIGKYLSVGAKDIAHRFKNDKVHSNNLNNFNSSDYISQNNLIEDQSSFQINSDDEYFKSKDSNYHRSTYLDQISANAYFKPLGINYSPQNAKIEDFANNEEFQNSILRFYKNAEIFNYPNVKRGYLRIKIKSQFKLLYFILEKNFQIIFGQGYLDKSPKIFAIISLLSVKPCRASELDKNFCFKLISPTSEFILQATSSEEMNEWIKEIKEAISNSLSNEKGFNMDRIHRNLDEIQNFPKDSAQERAIEMLTSKSNKLEINELKNITGNQECADCGNKDPDWVSINVGVLICIRCSGVHRSLGVKISKVRSLSLDHITEHDLRFLMERGNDKMNMILEKNIQIPKPNKNTEFDELKRFIEMKYSHIGISI